ncbi:MAG: acyltransferase family protein [Anaerolineae bacterium]|nr:acyltransferase family protein [Anaerolineae bacterium]
MAPSLRRHDLDWLRVLAVLLLIPFHSALIFALGPEHMVYIKDRVESLELLKIDGFIYMWHMPLLFVIAGAATWYALKRRSAGDYIRERSLRLALPFGFAVLTLIPLMTYVHYIGSPNAPTLLEHLGTFYTIRGDDLGGMNGHFTPAHLWFILFLFVYSLVALPLFLWLRRDSSAGIRQQIGRILARPSVLLLMPIPLALLTLLPSLADKNPFYFLGLFILGFLIMVDDSITATIDRLTPWALVIGVVAAGLYMAPNLFSGVPYPQRDTPVYIAWSLAFDVARWTWVLALMGLGHRLLNRDSAVLRYTNEAAYPIYILHLPVNTVVGYFIVRMDASIGVKYVLINLFTFVFTFAVYDVIVKRIPLLRLLFGMKPKAATVGAAPAYRRLSHV